MTGISGYIYVLWPGNDSTGQVLKVGRADILEHRLKCYPQGTKLLRCYLVDDHVQAERDLLRHLRSAFNVNRHYGSEYFACPNKPDFVAHVDRFMQGRLPADMATSPPGHTSESSSEPSTTSAYDIHASVLDIVESHCDALAGKTIKKYHQCPQWGVQKHTKRAAGTVIKCILNRMLGVTITGKHVCQRDIFEFPTDLQIRLYKARQFHQWFRSNFRVTNQTRDMLALEDIVALYHNENKGACPNSTADDYAADVWKVVRSYIKSYMVSIQANTVIGLVCVTHADLALAQLPRPPPPAKANVGAGKTNTDPAMAASIQLPFCPELLISRDQYLSMQANPIDVPNEPEWVTVHPAGAGADPMQVSKAVLVAGQRFLHHLAHDLYGIQSPVDRAFYDAFVGSACCPVARSKALEMHRRWRRYCRVKHMLLSADDSSDNAGGCTDEAGAGDASGGLTKEQQRDAQQLAFGSELLHILCPSHAEIDRLFRDSKVLLKNSMFEEHMRGYFGAMSEVKYKAVVDAFGFQRCRHGGKEVTTRNPKAVTSFATKVLDDAFGFILSKDGCRRKQISDVTWQLLSAYAV